MTLEEVLEWVKGADDFRELSVVHVGAVEKLYERAVEVYHRLAELAPDRVNSYLIQHGSYNLDDEGDITIEADEYWRYGGHEHHSDYFPAWWLWDSSWEQKVLEKKIEREQKKKREEEDRRKAKEEKERQTYERLRTKFEEDKDEIQNC